MARHQRQAEQELDALKPEVRELILAQAERGGYALIDTPGLDQLLKQEPDCLVIDARDPEAYEDDHILGSVNFTMENSLLARICKRAAFRRFLQGHHGPDLDRPLVFYCTRPTCHYSDSAPRAAMRLGYRRVYRYYPGIVAWMRARLPLEGLKQEALQREREQGQEREPAT